MDREVTVSLPKHASTSVDKLLSLLETVRKFQLRTNEDGPAADALPATGLLHQITALSTVLSKSGFVKEAEALQDVISHVCAPTDFGGLELDVNQELEAKDEAEILFLVSAYLEALNSIDRAREPLKPLSSRPPGRRGMTLSEKILAAHDVDRKGEVKPGDVVRVDVDWIMASELSYHGMESFREGLGSPDIFRNDRFWLAGDHAVDPRVKDNPRIKALVESSEKARRVFKMTEYQGMNYTIMHTEFSRERAQPGTLVIGSDSHTCSAGSMGALAIGLGTADVTMPLVTGETWFRVPESVCINFINRPGLGIGGKDVILYILKELKRNTVAADRVVEYAGPGLKYLSCDARFAIANMTTEFGGVTGIFVADEITHEYIRQRKNPKYKNDSTYYRPDEDAEYAITHTIDLAKVEPFIARYPAPDDVVPISEMEGTALDGCFIGACTTTEEDHILACLVLEEAMKRGMKPVSHGKRKTVPGSLPILNKLRKLGLTDIYEKAGFEVGVPGCSYCVGISADKAAEGETWLSSQNRNFKNRMGPGSIGHVTSAVTVAVSSFNMKITNPGSLLAAIDMKRVEEMTGHHSLDSKLDSPIYVEPGFREEAANPDEDLNASEDKAEIGSKSVQIHSTEDDSIAQPVLQHINQPSSKSSIKKGKIQVLGDFIDTDALAPNESLMACKTNEEFGEYCLKYTHPDFRQRAKNGENIIVAGTAFGCGSSREVAVGALLGVGVQCVIAKSFSFIYGRNAPNLGLLGAVMKDAEFFELAVDGASASIDLDASVIVIEGEGGKKRNFELEISPMERQLVECGGISEAWKKWGKGLWEETSASPGGKGKSRKMPLERDADAEKVEW